MNTNSSELGYEPAAYWAKLPMGVTFRGDGTSVAVDSKDNVYVFNRGNFPIVVFDPDGNMIRRFGDGEFMRAHGIFIDAEDNLYLVDDTGHFVQKRTNSGEIVYTIGEPGKPAEWQGGKPFNRPTDVVVHPKTGDLFVSDGYGNSAVHHFDANGKYIKSWGTPGSAPGAFSLPHNISLLDDERLIVADRENFRLQIFNLDGEFLAQWHVHHPMSVTVRNDLVFVGEMAAPSVQDGVPNLGNCVSIWNTSGEMVDRLGASHPGNDYHQFIAPHGIAVDSQGSIYVAEVAWTFFWSTKPDKFIGEPVSVRKWSRSG